MTDELVTCRCGKRDWVGHRVPSCPVCYHKACSDCACDVGDTPYHRDCIITEIQVLIQALKNDDQCRAETAVYRTPNLVPRVSRQVFRALVAEPFNPTLTSIHREENMSHPQHCNATVILDHKEKPNVTT